MVMSEHQGRDNFESCEKGWEFEIKRGLQGYNVAVYWKEQYFIGIVKRLMKL